MVTCPRCGRGNEGKYRFCLGCGAALPAGELRQTAAVVAKPTPAPAAPSATKAEPPAATARAAAAANAVPPANALVADSAAAARTPAESLQLPPRQPSSAHKPAAVSADPVPADDSATAAIAPILVGTGQFKKPAGGPAISPRAARSAKSQPIQAVVITATPASGLAIAEDLGPSPTPALGIGGGTLRQGSRQGDRPKSGVVAAQQAAKAPAAALDPAAAADSPTSQNAAAMPGFAVSPSAPSASQVVRQAPPRPQALPPVRAPIAPAAPAAAKPASGAAPPIMRYSQPVSPPGSRAGLGEIAPMPSPRPVPAPPPPNQVTCPVCKLPVPPSNAFCGGCGATNPHHTPTLPMPQGKTMAAPERLGYVALIDDNGGESVQFPLMAGENRIGSGDTCQLRFPDDGFLARVHCTVEADPGKVVLRPLDHSNGVFLRITTPVELQHGEIVRIGQEILRFERFDRLTPEVSADSLQESVGWQPPRGVWGRLCQLGLSRQVANAYLLSSADVFLGRERGDILFPRDGFVSGSHAVLSDRNGRSFLKDLGSSNGTFVRVKHDTPLRNGDLFLLGRNLLRVHLGATS